MAKAGSHPGGAHIRNSPRGGGKTNSPSGGKATPRSKMITQSVMPQPPSKIYNK